MALPQFRHRIDRQKEIIMKQSQNKESLQVADFIDSNIFLYNPTIKYNLRPLIDGEMDLDTDDKEDEGFDTWMFILHLKDRVVRLPLYIGKGDEYVEIGGIIDVLKEKADVYGKELDEIKEETVGQFLPISHIVTTAENRAVILQEIARSAK